MPLSVIRLGLQLQYSYRHQYVSISDNTVAVCSLREVDRLLRLSTAAHYDESSKNAKTHFRTWAKRCGRVQRKNV